MGRVSVVALCLTIVAVSAPPSSPSQWEDRPAPPDLEAVRVLEDLATWLEAEEAGDSAESAGGLDLVEALRLRRRSFDLFRSYADAEDRWRLLERLPYGELLGRAAERHGLDGLLLAAVAQAESGFDPEAVSPQGAIGLMQVMPDTASLYRVEEPADPGANVEVGARYLAWLLDRYGGDLELALAAYNAGPGNVDRFGDIPPFRETRSYVDRVLGHYVRHHRELWRTSGEVELIF